MKVILLKDVPNIGKIHDVVTVKDGYAKNYLIKNKLAVISSQTANDKLQQDLSTIASEIATKRGQAIDIKTKLEQLTLEFVLPTNHGKVFGTISTKAIIDKIQQQSNIKLDKYMFELNDQKNISLGQHQLKIRLFNDVIATLHINVNEALGS
ncbi:MAG: 50S ribosomal protein L9 [Mycoplasmataceae bacterium]|jgi:large subunit ribosomal protein L9|nr:50S ribosomal protein L9 [Mycoplasmataceae bacterium]